MTWPRITFIVLIVCVLLGGWHRYSIEKGRVRRLAELYLWLGPILPFIVLRALHDAAGLAGFVPVAVVHVGLIGAALRAVTAAGGPTGTTPRLAGGLLVLGSTAVWLGALTFAGMELEGVASHRADHWFTCGAFLVGALITLAGFSLLTTLLREAGEQVLSQLGQMGFLLGVVTWALHLAFRATVMVSVAQDSVLGKEPAWYGALRLWSGAMYAIYMSLAYLATAAYGAAMLKTRWAGKGWGRTFVIFGLVAAAGFLSRQGGFDFPLLVQFMPYVMGMLLLRRAAQRVHV